MIIFVLVNKLKEVYGLLKLLLMWDAGKKSMT